MIEEADFLLEEHRSGPMRALDTHLAQWEWSSPPGRLEREYEVLMNTSYGRAVGYTNEYGVYADTERKMLNRARTIWISPQMQDIALYNAGVEFTEPDFDGDEGRLGVYQTKEGRIDYRSAHRDIWLAEDRLPLLRREMLPEESGFIVLGKPFLFTDYDDRIAKESGPQAMPMMNVTAIAWDVVPTVSTPTGPKPGIVIYVYLNPSDMAGADGYYTLRHIKKPPLTMVDFSGWSFDQEFHVVDWLEKDYLDGATEMNVKPHVAALRMFLASIWGLMQSYIVKDRPTRQQQKLAKRLKRPEDGDISVIHLRKFLQTIEHRSEAADYDEDGNPRWTHRWIVRGHWAWRACKCHPEGRHRVYINPYIKGPEYLPLILKEKVVSIDR